MIQQIGGSNKKDIVKMLTDGIDIKPISVGHGGRFIKLLDPGTEVDLVEDVDDSAWVNYYRKDDVSAVAFFYLDRPTNNLTPLAPVQQRVAGLD